mgnify:CR=1 FL=1
MATKKSNKLLYYLLGAVGVIIVFAIIGKSAGWIGGAKETEVEGEIDGNDVSSTT